MGVAVAPDVAGASSRPGIDYDVSVGDSYAAGYQPVTSARRQRDEAGFAYQVVHLARAKGYRFTLRNFGCDGATTATILGQKGCDFAAPGPDTASYPTRSQAAAAEQFIGRHRGHIGLITVSIGGNDILACSSPAIVVSCVTGALRAVKANMAVLLGGLRRAAGPKVPIIGSTYPDVLLGLDTSTVPADQTLATLSVTEFRRFVNPALAAAYAAVGGRLVDVTRATGAYTPLTTTTSDATYGTIPVAVADVCSYTYYCRLQDVHPTTKGYAVIARLIVGALPRRRS
jgi:lysophospholipase L1-like esterase